LKFLKQTENQQINLIIHLKKNTIMVVLTADNKEELMQLLTECSKKAIKEYFEAKDKVSKDSYLSVNQVRKEIGFSAKKIKRLITDGELKTTADGKSILRSSLNEYKGIKDNELQ